MKSILKNFYLNIIVLLIKLPFLNNLNSRSGNNYFHELISKFRPYFSININSKKYVFTATSHKTFNRFNKIKIKEPDTNLWIDSFSNNDVFWDIGANVGVFSFYSASRGIKTYSFEPDPMNYSELIKNILLNKEDKITPFLVAVGDKKIGNFPLEFDDDGLESGRSMRTLDTSGLKSGRNGINTISFNLESLIEYFNIDFPNHLKIDVDGNESMIILNNLSFLSNINLKSILIELDTEDSKNYEIILKELKKSNFVLDKKIDTSSKYFNHIFVKIEK